MHHDINIQHEIADISKTLAYSYTTKLYEFFQQATARLSAEHSISTLDDVILKFEGFPVAVF